MKFVRNKTVFKNTKLKCKLLTISGEHITHCLRLKDFSHPFRNNPTGKYVFIELDYKGFVILNVTEDQFKGNAFTPDYKEITEVELYNIMNDNYEIIK